MTVLEKLFDAADHHAEDACEADHAVGDLQDMLRAAWRLMTPQMQREFLQSDEVANVIDCGAREEFDVDSLLAELAA